MSLWPSAPNQDMKGIMKDPSLSRSYLNICLNQLWNCSRSCKTSVWNFYWVRHLHHQTLKGSHIEKETHCTNLFKVHLCICVCACFSLPVSGSKGECYLAENSNCFTWSQDEAGFAFCTHVWLPGTDQERERSQKLAAEQDRRELQLLEEAVWLVQTWEMQALCLVTSSDLCLFWGWGKLERSVIFPWGWFNQRVSSWGWTRAA